MQLPIKVTRYGFTSRIPLIQMLGLCLGPEYLTVDLAGQNKDIQLALNGVSDFLWWALHNIICSVWPFPLFSSWTNLLFWFWKLYLSMIFFSFSICNYHFIFWYNFFLFCLLQRGPEKAVQKLLEMIVYALLSAHPLKIIHFNVTVKFQSFQKSIFLLVIFITMFGKGVLFAHLLL